MASAALNLQSMRKRLSPPPKFWRNPFQRLSMLEDRRATSNLAVHAVAQLISATKQERTSDLRFRPSMWAVFRFLCREMSGSALPAARNGARCRTSNRPIVETNDVVRELTAYSQDLTSKKQV